MEWNFAGCFRKSTTSISSSLASSSPHTSAKRILASSSEKRVAPESCLPKTMAPLLAELISSAAFSKSEGSRVVSSAFSSLARMTALLQVRSNRLRTNRALEKVGLK